MISQVEVTSARSLAECYALLAQRPAGLRVLAGGTDLMVQLTAGIGVERLGHALDIWRVPELRQLSFENGTLRLGALTTYAELIESPLIATHAPALAAVSREIGAWAIQNRGTLGGNVCNASPAGDSLPLLLAAQAVFVVGGPRGERQIPSSEFFVGYRKTALGADELLLRIEVESDEQAGRMVYRKVGTRRAQSISKTLLAVRAQMRQGVLHRVRIAAGCLGPVPMRCYAAEAAAEGKRFEPRSLPGARAPVDASEVAAVQAALDADVKPIDDIRSTAHYRRRVSGNVLAQLLAELSGTTA